MKKSSLRNALAMTLVVFGFSSSLPANAARAARPPSTVQPPTPVSGL